MKIDNPIAFVSFDVELTKIERVEVTLFDIAHLVNLVFLSYVHAIEAYSYRMYMLYLY